METPGKRTGAAVGEVDVAADSIGPGCNQLFNVGGAFAASSCQAAPIDEHKVSSMRHQLHQITA